MTSGHNQGWLSRPPLPSMCKVQVYKALLQSRGEAWVLKVPRHRADEVGYSFFTFNTWSQAFKAAMTIQDFRNQP